MPGWVPPGFMRLEWRSDSASVDHPLSFTVPEIDVAELAAALPVYLLVVVGLALLVAGSQALVASATTFARALGVSDVVIGLTIVAGSRTGAPVDIPVSRTLTAPARTGWEPSLDRLGLSQARVEADRKDRPGRIAANTGKRADGFIGRRKPAAA